MASQALLTFDDVIEQANTPHLLIGNGFSMAYDKDRFSFTSLLDSAVSDGIISKDSNIYRLFEQLATSDFESIMRLLDDSKVVVSIYSKDESLQDQIAKDADDLKSYLVKIITNNHPEKSTSLLEAQKLKCVDFVKKFKNIYSLNYDLLLYWAIMQNNVDNFTDGFSNTEDSQHEGFVVYQNQKSKGFRIHYVHGALHIFDAGDEIIKKTYNNTDINLVDQVRDSLSKHIYPIFISEGSSEQKLTKILHSAYLNHCYRSLCRIGGDLVVYGASLKNNDDHVLRAIIDGNVKNIYFGVSSADNAGHIQNAVDTYNLTAPENKKKTLYLYGYKTIDVWGNN